MTLYQHIIPLARTPRSQTVEVPHLPTPAFRPPSMITQNSNDPVGGGHGGEDGMDVEPPPFVFGHQLLSESAVGGEIPKNSHLVTTIVQSDGLLLYVAEASFESGTSPLSNWVPIASYDVQHTGESKVAGSDSKLLGRPLDVFERLVLRRLQKRGMQVDGNTPNGIGQVVEVEMA